MCNQNSAFRGCFRLLPVIFVATLLGACAQTNSFTHEGFENKDGAPATVLLMPPDVEVYELSAAGIPEPRADWTKQARENVHRTLNKVLRAQQATMRSYDLKDDPIEAVHPRHRQLVKLHERVGESIRRHQYPTPYKLPTKDGKFDWTLGKGVVRLRNDYDADYALFVHFRDSFSSSGRVVVIAAAALIGVSVQGGQQAGFASLVDLGTGQIVWFNVMSSSTGDLRKLEPAMRASEALLDEVPL